MAERQESTEQLRAQAALLLSQARSQVADIQRALESLRGNAGIQSELQGAASELSGVISDLQTALQSGTVRSADLMAMRSAVQSSGVSGMLAQASAQASSQAAAQAVSVTAADTRRETQNLEHDVFEKKIFDRYLHFSSPEDETEYRRREAEAKRYVDAQLARKTPEGDLNAGGGMIGQMLDTNAHGAGASPDFLPRWNALVDKTTKQREAMHAAGQKTEEFDRNLNTAVRRFLKAKGLSDSEIDARLASGRDPLEAVKPYLGNDRASRQLEQATNPLAAAEVSPARVVALEAGKTPAEVKLDAISAGLKSAGVQLSSAAPVSDDGHGLPQLARQDNGKAGPSLPA